MALGWELIVGETNHMFRGLEFSASLPLKIEFNHQWVMIESMTATPWSFLKNSWTIGSGSFWVSEHLNTWRWEMLQAWRRHGSPTAQSSPPYLTLFPPPIWLFLSCILYNKPKIVSKVLSRVLGGTVGISKFVVVCGEVWIAWGSHLQPASEVRQPCGTEPLTCAVYTDCELCCNSTEWLDVQLVLEN